ncbi:MFS transporter [Candidatus Enterococcus leclercqii]|uniref:MFS transporter n=1 Tax=Candidatus Enterococcus leclercqii TaxID=1857218 RepID=UPI00137A7437|nr:MFS transporter [Enterococcus sp. CU9D]KAF1294203.1 hypothetical protein BAU14_07380 [Enterococcus sp. CU9D]
MSKNKPIFKLSILSISLICMVAPAVSATVPDILQSFPNRDSGSIELLMSVPNFGIFLFVLLAPMITRIISDKTTVLLGLTISLLAGVTPVFTTNYNILLVSRFLLGSGIGLFNALAYSLITKYYEGEERNRLLGYQAALTALGSTIFSLLAGWLLQFNWHFSYLVYLLALLPIVLFGLFIPSDKQTLDQSVVVEKATIKGAVIFYSVYMFFVYALFMTAIFKLASLFVEIGIGSPAQASLCLAVLTACGFFSGVIFGKVKQSLKEFTGPVAVAFLGIALGCLSITNNIFVVILLVIAIGFFQGLINPTIFSEVAEISNTASQNLASTCLLIGINLGVFLNPTVISEISNIARITTTSNTFRLAGVLLVVGAIVYYLAIQIQSKKAKKVTE